MSLFAILLGVAFAQDEVPEPPPAEEVPAEEPATSEGPSAEDLARAKELFTNGRNLFDEGSYREAITAWEASYNLSQREALLFNIASAAERMGDFDGALEALNRYRAFATEEETESLLRRMRNLEDQRDKAAAEDQEAAKAAEEEANVANTAAVPAPAPKKVGQGQRVVGGVLIGAGVASVGTGVVLGILSNGKQSAATENCLESGLCLVDSKETFESSRSLAVGADVALGAGILSAGIGTVLVLTAPKNTTVSISMNSITLHRSF